MRRRWAVCLPLIFLIIPIILPSETLSVDVGQIVVGVGFPLVTLKLGNLLETVVGVVAVITR